MKTNSLKRIFQYKIDDTNFIIYNDKRCRIDDGKTNTTTYYSENDRMDFWKKFQEKMEPIAKNSLTEQAILDRAFTIFIGW